MIRVIDVDSSGLTTEQIIDSVRDSDGAILRRDGHVIARIEAADDLDLADDAWARSPAQLARRDAARKRFAQKKVIGHAELKRRLAAKSRKKAKSRRT